MIEDSVAPSAGAENGDRYPDHRAYIASQRALSACSREFTRLGDAIIDGLGAVTSADVAPKAESIRTPDRCIVQLGPVALTLGWLRSTPDSVADGRLLVIVWQGTVTPRRRFHVERPAAAQQPAKSATVLWECEFAAEAASEATWTWRSVADVGHAVSSDALAASCVERLSAALDATGTDQPPPVQ
jgi:hypothetical protein